jgi:hypothetical protein
VSACLDAAHAPTFAHETVIFTPPRALHRGRDYLLIAQSDGRTGEILTRLHSDDELWLQLTLSAAPVAAAPEVKSFKGSAQFLGIIIYGPKSRLHDVGDFVTQCHCYLDDPFGCEHNVPYMNPQCLFTLRGYPQLTFDLPQPPQQSFTDFTRSSSDILEGFETTDHFEEAADPPALRTALQAYVKDAHKKHLLNLGSTGTNVKR